MSFERHSIVQVDQVPQRSFRGLVMHKSSAHAFSLLAVCLFSLILRFCPVLACAQFSCTPMFYDACVDKAQRPCLAMPLAVVADVSVVRAYAYSSRL